MSADPVFLSLLLRRVGGWRNLPGQFKAIFNPAKKRDFFVDHLERYELSEQQSTEALA